MRSKMWLILLGVLLLAGGLFAAEPSDEKTKELERKIEELQRQIENLKSQSPGVDVQELKRQLDILAAEVEKLRSGEEESVELLEATRLSLGLGPSAASVYTKKQGVSIAGYGEMLYENFGSETDSGNISNRFDQIDFLRAIVYVGYRFNDKFLFNSEIEFEHASTGDGIGEVSVEFAHLDYRATDDITLRGGMVLVPMGLVNEFHEPTVFLGARRSLTESQILPTTWRENGFGVLGRVGVVDFRAYLINGLNSAGFTSSGIRDGRQSGARAKINPAFVARADVTPIPGMMLGGSIYFGESEFFAETFNPGDHYNTTIGEIHGEYRRGPLDIRALYAASSIDDVARLNLKLGLTGIQSVGESQGGGYIQGGYNVLAHHSSHMSLIPYVRFENVNTQKDVPPGFASNPARDVTAWTFGAQFLPIPNIVIKMDYQDFDNDSDSAIDQFNIALGYSF